MGDTLGDALGEVEGDALGEGEGNVEGDLEGGKICFILGAGDLHEGGVVHMELLLKWILRDSSTFVWL